MARIDKDLTGILESVRKRLTSKLHDANSPNCFIALDPLELYNGRPGDFFYVVSPFSGTFDEGLIDGGGLNQVADEASIAITIHSIQNLDRPDEDAIFLNHADLGLLGRFKEVLRIMVAADLTDDEGNEITFEPVMPKSYSIGRERGENPTGWIQLVMKVKFDWDLVS